MEVVEVVEAEVVMVVLDSRSCISSSRDGITGARELSMMMMMILVVVLVMLITMMMMMGRKGKWEDHISDIFTHACTRTHWRF